MHHQMRVMGIQGDSAAVWEDTDTEAQDAAKQQFEALMKDGHLAFRIDSPTKPGEQIRKFDREAPEILMVPPVAGG